MPIVRVATRASANGATAVTTVNLALTGMTVGNKLIIRTAVDNIAIGGTATTQSLFNWTGTPLVLPPQVNQNQTNDPGAVSEGTTCFLVVAAINQTSGTIRLAYGGNVIQCCVAEEWSGIHPTAPLVGAVVKGNNSAGSGTYTNLTIPSVTQGNLVYAAVAVEGPASDTFTQDADTTGGAWTDLTRVGTTTGGTFDTNQTINGGFKVVTITGSQTYNATGTASRDVAAILVELANAPTNATANPATVSAVAAVASPTVSAPTNQTATPTAVLASAAISTPTVSAETNRTATPAAVAAATAIAAPTVTMALPATASPSTVALIAKTGSAGGTWTPPVVANLALWLDASQLSLTNGDPVSSWPDTSGAGATTVSTGFASPTFQTNIINGLPVVRFWNGTGQALRTTMTIGLPYTVAVIGRLTGTGNQRLFGSVHPDAQNWIVGWWGGYEDVMYAEGFVAAGSVAATTNWAIYTATGTGSLSSFWESGNLIASNAIGVAGPNGRLALSGYAPASGEEMSNGELAEIVGFSRVLTTPERQQLEGYLAWRYGLQAGLPAGHPYLAAPPTAAGTAPVISTGSKATPTTVAAIAALPGRTVSTGQKATPAAVSAIAAVPSPSLSTGSTAFPKSGIALAPILSYVLIAAPVVATGSRTTPTVVISTATVASPGITTGSRTTPAVVISTATVGTVSVSAGTGTIVAPSAVSAATSVGSPVVGAGQRAAPLTVAALSAIGALAVSSSTTSEPVAVAASATVGAPALSTTRSDTATPLTVAVWAIVGSPISYSGPRHLRSPLGVAVQPATTSVLLIELGVTTMTIGSGRTVNSVAIQAATTSVALTELGLTTATVELPTTTVEVEDSGDRTADIDDPGTRLLVFA